MMDKTAIVVALDREVHPLIRQSNWRRTDRVRSPYGCYERGSTVVVCAGIGPAAAAEAAERVLQTVAPALIISAGFAGAIVPGLQAGDVLVPATVVNTATGACFNSADPGGRGVLLSIPEVAAPEAKRLLAQQWSAQAADMEAAWIAEAARARGIEFIAVKAISEESDFPMPNLHPYVRHDGKFQTGKFLLAMAPRPGMWGIVRRLRSKSRRASEQLCRTLEQGLSTGRFASGKMAGLEASGLRDSLAGNDGPGSEYRKIIG